MLDQSDSYEFFEIRFWAGSFTEVCLNFWPLDLVIARELLREKRSSRSNSTLQMHVKYRITGNKVLINRKIYEKSFYFVISTS